MRVTQKQLLEQEINTMNALWSIYTLVGVMLVIVLIIAAIGFSRSGRKKATEFRGVEGQESEQRRHEKEAPHR